MKTRLLFLLLLLLATTLGACSSGDDDDASPSLDDDVDDDLDDDVDDDADDDLDDDIDDDLDDDIDDDLDDDLDDDTVDDDSVDDDSVDDDSIDDDAVDDDIIFEPWVNPNAKADAFRLFYRERMSRVLLAYNRFALVNDVVPAITLGSTFIDKQDDTYEVVLHPKDNNDIGFSAYQTYQAYKVFRTREMALTLIRQFEGLAVAEEVQGIPGLTCREWQPGFTVTIDGPADTIARERDGAPVSPAVAYPGALEQEIVDAFFADGVYRYRGNPAEYYFAFESLINITDYALTFVHEMMPDYLRVSDCCSSFMVSKLGTYQGYFWGNHNSRDNFPDYGMGYIAAGEAMNDLEADADVRASAARAFASGQRVGDSVVEYEYNLMTVPEGVPYNEDNLIVAGRIRPDGMDEGWEGLGSMNSCQMSYMAKALSSDGLQSPDEEVQNPGAYEIIAIKALFELLGLPAPDITKTCHSLDDAYIGMTWGDLLTMEVFGVPLWDLVEMMVNALPDTFVPLLLNLADALDQPEMAAYAVVYYARLQARQGDDEVLLQKAKETLYHIAEIQRRSSQMALDWAMDQPTPPANIVNEATRLLNMAARYAHGAGVGNEDFDPLGFAQGDTYSARFEAVLTRPNSTPLPLRTDDEIWTIIYNAVTNCDRPPVVERYWAAFPTQADMPLRRFGDHYEAVGLDGAFHEISNISHQWFGSTDLWNEAPLCALEPTVLDCAWALLGCERPDLVVSGLVDQADQDAFDDAWGLYGQGASCDGANSWCDGADLDRDGTLTADDQQFMSAAQGCWYEL